MEDIENRIDEAEGQDPSVPSTPIETLPPHPFFTF